MFLRCILALSIAVFSILDGKCGELGNCFDYNESDLSPKTLTVLTG